MAEVDRGAARLESALRQARDAGDPVAWMTAAAALYERRRGRGGRAEDRAALRDEMVQRSEAIRERFRSRVGRLWAAALADGIAGQLLQDLLEESDPPVEEVFRLAEAAKARTLLDLTVGHFRGLAPDAADAAALEHEVLSFTPDETTDLVGSELRLASELPLGSRDPGNREEEQQRSDRLRRAEEAYATAGAGFFGLAKPATLEQVRAALAPDELLVEYLIPHSPMHPAIALAVLVVAREGAEVVPVPLEGLPHASFIGRISVDGKAPVDYSPLGYLVASARIAVQERTDDAARPLLGALHDLLVTPVLASTLAAGRERWIIVPHRLLHPVPWAALEDADGRTLFAAVSPTLAPSASVWLAMLESEPVPRTCLALANPLVTYSGLPALPDAEAEVAAATERWTAGGFACTTLSGLRANERALREQAAGSGIVYLAAHGAFPQDNALDFHRLLLSRTRHDAGPVTAEQLRRLDLRATWCTVLSICDGGLYRVGPGDEPYGLLPAVFGAGSRNVIAAQWQVDDRRGRELMTAAAERLPERSPAEALGDAARELAANPRMRIRDWAAFVAVGAGRRATWATPAAEEPQASAMRTTAAGSP